MELDIQITLMVLDVLVLSLSFVLCRAGNRPPNIYVQPESGDIYFKPGETVQIPCIAGGVPKPQYIWKVNGEVYNPSGRDDRVVQLPQQGTLVFNNPEDKDEGIFQCFADNGYGVSVAVKVGLRIATLKMFIYEPKSTHRVQLGRALTLPCTPPQSSPSADVYWVYRASDGRWEAVNFNKRITMDFEGKLRFTNTKKADEAGGRTYCCMAINYFMRNNAIGPRHQVQVLGVSEQMVPAHELWASPSDQFFLRGTTLRLKCIFAGSPTPEVYWERVDATFQDRATFKSFGQELQITNLELTDAGQYQCMGLNTQSIHRPTKAFNVRIESAPYWLEEPDDIEASIDEKATFICRAAGIPGPDYDWFINGVPLEDRQNMIGVRDTRIYNNNRFFRRDRNTIALTNLTLDDHMNIQCNASNKHGYVFSDVYLNVLAEMPTIIKSPPIEKKVTEGRSVTLDCLVTGKPDPTVAWYRDASLISGGRFKIMPNGNLHIEKVVMADAGGYRCQAFNVFGRVTSHTCRTQIRRRTIIEQFPMDLEVTAGQNAKFSCSGSTDFNEARTMLTYWEKDDNRIYTNEQRMTQNFQDNSLTISGTIIRDSGVYTCVVTNGLDEARAYAILTVKDRPDPPISVEIVRCLDTSAELKWIKGIENNAPVQYFVVQYNTSFIPDQWVSVKLVEYTQNTVSVDLQPWANYTFRVIATNKIGSSIPSLHTGHVCTNAKPDRPDTNPHHVRSVGDSRNTLKIKWTPMPEVEHNGPGFKYQLTVRERGSTQTDVYNIDNWRNDTVEIQNITTVYAPYIVKLQSKNNMGFAKEDPVVQIMYSFEDIPKVRPYNITVFNCGDTNAQITWIWDVGWLEEEGEMTQIQGQMRGFKIQHWRTDEKLNTFHEVELWIEDLMPSKRPLTDQVIVSEYVLANLSPYSTMQIQVRVFNNYYVGPPSNALSFNTLEGVPGPVTWFVARTRSSNSITLAWQKPSVEDTNGVLKGYDIGYQTVDYLDLGKFQDRVEQINDPDVELALLGGLIPNQKYRVHIFARTRYGRGQGVFIEVCTVSVTTLICPVFDTQAIAESSLNVSWTADSSIWKHVVHYVEFRKEGAAAWQKSLDIVLRNYTLLTDLEAGTNYEVRLVVFNGQNRNQSQTKIIRTGGYASPRALAVNYGWFIVMISSGLFVIGVTVVILLVHRCRKHVKDRPKFRKGFVIRDSVYLRHRSNQRDTHGDTCQPLVRRHARHKDYARHGYDHNIRYDRGHGYKRIHDTDRDSDTDREDDCKKDSECEYNADSYLDRYNYDGSGGDCDRYRDSYNDKDSYYDSDVSYNRDKDIDGYYEADGYSDYSRDSYYDKDGDIDRDNGSFYESDGWSDRDRGSDCDDDSIYDSSRNVHERNYHIVDVENDRESNTGSNSSNRVGQAERRVKDDQYCGDDKDDRNLCSAEYNHDSSDTHIAHYSNSGACDQDSFSCTDDRDSELNHHSQNGNGDRESCNGDDDRKSCNSDSDRELYIGDSDRESCNKNDNRDIYTNDS